MNLERLSILQDLSKGSQIYFEESVRRPEAVNLDALMRATAGDQESSDWEVYAKKKIGEDITLLKKFTYAEGIGKVTVILDLRGELSISEYDIETGKKVLGEGYLQVSRFSSPIEVTVTEVSLIRNKSSESPQISGSSNLLNEFNEMLEKAKTGEMPSDAVVNEDQPVEIAPEETGMEELAGDADGEEEADKKPEVEVDQVTEPEKVQEELAEEPEATVDTETNAPALPAEEQLAKDTPVYPSTEPVESENQARDTYEAIKLAVEAVSKAFTEEMRIVRAESEVRISGVQEDNKKQIEEINARYAEQIAKSSQEHEERVREITARIEGLEAENSTLIADIEQQKQDFERKLEDLRETKVSGENVSAEQPELEVFTSDNEGSEVQKPHEEVEVEDNIIIDNNGRPRAKDGTFLSPKDFENKRTRNENDDPDSASKPETKDKFEAKTHEYKLDNGWIIYSPRKIRNIMEVKTAAISIINTYEPDSMELGWIESKFRKELKKLKKSYTSKLLHQFKLIPPVLKKED